MKTILVLSLLVITGSNSWAAPKYEIFKTMEDLNNSLKSGIPADATVCTTNFLSNNGILEYSSTVRIVCDGKVRWVHGVSEELATGNPIDKMTVFAPFMKSIGLSLTILEYKYLSIIFARK